MNLEKYWVKAIQRVSKKYFEVKCSHMVYTGYCLFLKYSSIACFYFPLESAQLIIVAEYCS